MMPDVAQREIVQPAHPSGYDVIVDTLLPMGDGPPHHTKVTAHSADFAALLRFPGHRTGTAAADQRIVVVALRLECLACAA